MSDDEPRTIRDARTFVRALETDVELVQMSPAMALTTSIASWYLRRARLALRQAERWLAKADDPRLAELRPLSPQIPSQRAPRPRRRRHRCTQCFEESLRHAGEDQKCYRIDCGGDVEPVARRSTR